MKETLRILGMSAATRLVGVLLAAACLMPVPASAQTPNANGPPQQQGKPPQPAAKPKPKSQPAVHAPVLTPAGTEATREEEANDHKADSTKTAEPNRSTGAGTISSARFRVAGSSEDRLEGTVMWIQLADESGAEVFRGENPTGRTGVLGFEVESPFEQRGRNAIRYFYRDGRDTDIWEYRPRDRMVFRVQKRSALPIPTDLADMLAETLSLLTLPHQRIETYDEQNLRADFDMSRGQILRYIDIGRLCRGIEGCSHAP